MITYSIKTIDELAEPAEKLKELLKDYPVVCLNGEMGAGKTTFIKKVCELLGVQDETSSPTFSIVNEYRDENDDSVYHFDFYRIKSAQEALDIGAEEYFYSGDPCLIEWPDKINELIPEEHLEININLVENNHRELTISVPA
ncbi:MAG: tRNA (adenosine(37)-N6)-threonylcarbamoyltransferase complex ATPase subunit type 1 TsaE [Cyclobacteriaceae bacterium]